MLSAIFLVCGAVWRSAADAEAQDEQDCFSVKTDRVHLYFMTGDTWSALLGCKLGIIQV